MFRNIFWLLVVYVNQTKLSNLLPKKSIEKNLFSHEKSFELCLGILQKKKTYSKYQYYLY